MKGKYSKQEQVLIIAAKKPINIGPIKLENNISDWVIDRFHDIKVHICMMSNFCNNIIDFRCTLNHDESLQSECIVSLPNWPVAKDLPRCIGINTFETSSLELFATIKVYLDNDYLNYEYITVNLTNYKSKLPFNLMKRELGGKVQLPYRTLVTSDYEKYITYNERLIYTGDVDVTLANFQLQ